MNRQQLDAFAPSPALWQKIDAGLQQPAIIKSHTSWLKHFAYGASAIAVAVSIGVLLRSHTETPSTASLTTTHTVNPPETPAQSSIPGDTTSTETEKKVTTAIPPSAEVLPEPPVNTDEAVVPYTPALPALPVLYSLPEQPVTPEQPEAPVMAASYLPNRATYRGKHTDSLNVDTSFVGITHFQLIVSTADVVVKPSGTASIGFKAKLRVEERGMLVGENKFDVQYERKDSLMTVRIVNKSNRRVMISGYTDVKSVAELAVPDGIMLGINDQYGNVKIEGIKTKAYTIESSSGDIAIQNSKGPLKLSCNYGDVSLANLEGNIDTHAGSGNLSISGLNGNAQIGASYGNITLKELSGAAKINTTSGDVSICKMTGNLEVVSAYGNIRLQDYKGTPKLSATSGDITGKNVEIQEAMTTYCTYGSVDMKLLNNFSDLSFDLSTHYGTISVPGTKTTENPAKLQVTKGRIMVKGTTTSGDQKYQ